MTITDSVIQWLTSNPSLDIVDIETDNLGDVDTPQYALFQTPQDTVDRLHIDGSRIVSTYRIFNMRQAAVTDGMRRSNQQWLEDFTTWVNAAKSLPVLDGVRACISVTIEGGAFMQERVESNAIYQAMLKIKYYEGVTT